MPRPDPSDVVAEARAWVGTPFLHRAWRCGHGVDCVGLVRGVAQNIGALVLSPEEWGPFETYARTPNPEKMRQAMELFLRPSDLSRTVIAPDGFVGWFEWRENLPMHIGIVATFQGRRTLIHALFDVGRCVEHGFNPSWLRRVNSWWRIPGVQY